MLNIYLLEKIVVNKLLVMKVVTCKQSSLLTLIQNTVSLLYY
jgi:hypothetical protein